MASAAPKIDPKKPKKSTTSEPEVQPVTENLDQNEIAARAYQLWQERRCPIGTDQKDWLKAEMS